MGEISHECTNMIKLLPPCIQSRLHCVSAGRHSIILYPSRHWNGDCKSCNIPSGCGISVAGFTTDPANLVYPVVTDYNVLLGCGNKVLNSATALSPAEQGLQSFTMPFPEDTNGIVNPPMPFPAAECLLQGSQQTRPTLFTPLYPATTPYPAVEMGLQV